MVPNGWEKSDLTHLITIKHGFAFKSEFYSDKGQYVLLTPGSFYETGGFRDQGSKTKYYIGDIPDGYILSQGDMLLAMTEQAEGLLGSALFVPENNRYLHNQRLGLVQILNQEKVCKDFLYLFFNSPSIRKQITEQSTGTKVKHTSPDRLCSVIGLIPPLKEQQKIAEIISTWDQAISATEKLLENSQQQKKALMQQLLVEKKSFNGESFVFQKKRFSEVVKIDERTLGAKTPDNFEFDYISLSDVNLGKISSKLQKFVYKDAPSRARRLVKEGDILLSTVRPNLQGFAKVSRKYESCVASTGFSVLTPKEGVCGDYLYHYLFSTHITGQINALVVGTNYPAINSSDVSKLFIYCPEYEDQLKIARILNSCDCTITVLQKRLDCLKQEKKALMQQLLTGKKRVKVAA